MENIYFLLFIALIGIISIILMIKRNRDSKRQEFILFEETNPKAEFRLLEVKDMADEKVQETIAFLQEISDDPSIPTPTIERNGNIVRLKLDARLCLSDFASWVNNFIFSDEAGKTYEVVGRYPVGTATLDKKDIHNTPLTFYTPANLEKDDVQCAFFKTKDGKKYRYDLGFKRIDKTDKE
jgi:hypothetical protein